MPQRRGERRPHHRVTLSNGVASGSASVTGGVGSISGSPTFAGNKMTVNLTGVTNAQQITVELSGVTDAVGQTLPPSTVPLGVLLGDVTANKQVNASDVASIKSQSGGSPVSGSNFRADLNVDGSINAADIGMARSAAGTGIP